MNLNLNDFQYVVTIAQFKSFGKAAQELFISQSALSQRIKTIERAYNIKLFSRSHTGVQLTAEGACFVKSALKILRTANDLEAEILYHQNSPSQLLRFGISLGLSASFCHDLILRFCSLHPELSLNITEQTSSALQEGLLENKLDLALCYLPAISPDLSCTTVFQDSYVLFPAASSRLAEIIHASCPPYSKISPELLNNEAFSIAAPGQRLNKYLSEIIELYQITPGLQHTIRTPALLYKLAKCGIASTILFRSFFKNLPEEEPYYYLDCDIPSDLSLALLWRDGSHFKEIANELAILFNE